MYITLGTARYMYSWQAALDTGSHIHVPLRFGVGLCEIQASSRACVAVIISTTHCRALWNTVTSVAVREREGGWEREREGRREGRRERE